MNLQLASLAVLFVPTSATEPALPCGQQALPLRAPIDPIAIGTPGSVISLDWGDVSERETLFRVQGSSDGQTWTDVLITGPDEEEATFSGAPWRLYRLRAENLHTSSNWSPVAVLSPLAPPAELSGEVLDFSSIRFDWFDESGNEARFEIEARKTSGGWSRISIHPADAESGVFAGLEPSTSYAFHARAVGAPGVSLWSNEVVIATPACPVPLAPASLGAVALAYDRIRLTWDDVATNESAYRVARLDPGEDENNPAHWENYGGSLPPGTTALEVSGLQAGSNYEFKVRCESACGQFSPYSAVVTCSTPPCPAPAAPILGATALSPYSIRLTWLDLATNELTYRVARLDPGEDPGNPAHWDNIGGGLPANTTAFDVHGLQPSTTYRFKVRCQSACGEYSPYSNVVACTTLPCPAPLAPAGLSGAALSTSSIRMNWVDRATDEAAYRVAKLDPGEDENNPAQWDSVSGDLPANTTEFTLSGLYPGSTYRFKVRCQSVCGTYSDHSAVVAVTTLPLPAPFGLTATRQGSTPAPDPILVQWSYSGPGVDGFRVARLDPGEDAANPNHWDSISADLPHGTRSYLDALNLQNGQLYRYKVRAFVVTPWGRVYSAYSNSESGRP